MRRVLILTVLTLSIAALAGCGNKAYSEKESSEIINLNPESMPDNGNNGKISAVDGNSSEEDLNTGEVNTIPKDTELTEESESGEERIAPMELDAETYEYTHGLVREIINLYHKDGKEERVEELLNALEKTDPGQGELWRGITEYWGYANDEMTVHIDTLPGDLPKDDSLCIMILGFELNSDGSMQPELIGRLQVALECAKQYPNAWILCTGGGSSFANPQITEADLMGEWLLKNGLKKDRLIIENKSLTTAENALNSYAILLDRYPQVDSVAVLSSSYHIAWGSLLLESSFRKAAYEQQLPELHVISNCAYECTNAKYADTLRFERGGMMQLIGEEYLAMQYYSGQMR